MLILYDVSTLLCQFTDLVTFAYCVFIFALRNITLGGYLDTHKNTSEHLIMDGVWPEIYTEKIRAIE